LIDPPTHFHLPVGQPTLGRAQSPPPTFAHSYHTRFFDDQGYDCPAAIMQPDIPSYDPRVRHDNAYHLQRPLSHMQYGMNAHVFNTSDARDHDEPNNILPDPIMPFVAVVSPHDSDNSRSTNCAETNNRPTRKIVRFLKSLYPLPWIASRITADYEPGARIDSHHIAQVKIGSSWYPPRRYSLDLLSSGESMPTVPVIHRRDGTDRTSISGTGSSSLQTATPGHYRSQGAPKNHARHISVLHRGHGQRRRVQRKPDILASPTIRGHRLHSSSHGRHRSGTPPNRGSDKRHKSQLTRDIESSSREQHSYGFPTYPHMMAVVPCVPPPQPLYIVTPPGAPHSPSPLVGLHQAVPLYILTPRSPSVVLSAQGARGLKEPTRKQSSSPQPIPETTNSHHTLLS
jgi:hypothetical protein